MIEPFWSDSLDVDLPKVIPGLDAILGPAAVIPLWTYGGTTGGRLNHPSVWHSNHGFVSFFGLNPATIGKPSDHSTSHDVVECTWREALRDAWAHHNSIVVFGQVVWDATPLMETAFTELMYGLRGWKKLADGVKDQYVASVSEAIRAATVHIGRLQSSMWRVGAPAYIRQRLAPDAIGYDSAMDIFTTRGRIVSIEDGWAMVEIRPWGQFGCNLADLRPSPSPATR